jgi:hypothetical protein
MHDATKQLITVVWQELDSRIANLERLMSEGADGGRKTYLEGQRDAYAGIRDVLTTLLKPTP